MQRIIFTLALASFLLLQGGIILNAGHPQDLTRSSQQPVELSRDSLQQNANAYLTPGLSAYLDGNIALARVGNRTTFLSREGFRFTSFYQLK